MKVNKDDDGGTPNQNQNQNQGHSPRTGLGLGSKGKSCKGCLYYSSLHRSKAQNPTCVGFTRSLNQVPSNIVRESDPNASEENRNLADFKYSCIGYSVHLEQKDTSTDPQVKQAELPICVGLEVVLGKRISHAEQVPSHVHKREVKNNEPVPQPRTHRPLARSPWDAFMIKFERNAGVVARGVARSASRVGKRMKNSLDDILFP